MTDREPRSISPEIKQTGDGSHTLYSTEFDQHYHNPGGAVAESRHIFFDSNGLLDLLAGHGESPIHILEVGFGTGLNLLLLLDYCVKMDAVRPVFYTGIEAHPISFETAGSLNYGRFLDNPGLSDKIGSVFNELENGMNRFEMPAGVTLNLFAGTFGEFVPGGRQADFIFHDPFSPDVNPELWTGTVFQKLASWSQPDALLSTYCAASAARGAMCWAGWHVARGRGALGKREMTLASLNPEKLSHLERVNEKRLARRYERNDF